jgi:hypothetical protein
MVTFATKHAFIVHYQSSITKQPGKCSFNDPPFWLLVPPAHPRGTLNNLEFPATRSPAPVRKLMSLIGLVRPNLGQSRDKILQTGEETACAKRVVHIGWRDVEGEGQAQGIHQQMAFAPFNGLITNDKFCLTRHVRLRLRWSRAPLRLPTQARMTYLSGESAQVHAHRGGGHETAMVHPSPGNPLSGRATTVGSRLPTPAGVDDGA